MSGTELQTRGNGSSAMAPMNLDPMTIARAFKESGMFPDLKSEAQAVVKIVAGQELGFGPMASMQAVQMIQGKPTLSANGLAALVKRHPAYDYRVREHTDQGCRIEFFQGGEPAGESTFTAEDAQRAGLAGNFNWKKYPKAMMFARALSQGVRWFCPDVTAGAPAYVPEELGAEVNEEGEAVREDAPAVEAQASEPEPKPEDAIGPERAEQIVNGIKALHLPYKSINLMLGSAGLDALRANSAKAVTEAIEALTPEQADALEAELEREAEGDA